LVIEVLDKFPIGGRGIAWIGRTGMNEKWIEWYELIVIWMKNMNWKIWMGIAMNSYWNLWIIIERYGLLLKDMKKRYECQNLWIILLWYMKLLEIIRNRILKYAILEKKNYMNMWTVILRIFTLKTNDLRNYMNMWTCDQWS